MEQPGTKHGMSGIAGATRSLTPPAVLPIDCCAANSLNSMAAAVDADADDLSDEDYFFASTYRPLSNLPTPPPSSRNSSALPSPQLEQGEALEESLLGPAIHLVNLLPPAASLATPSVPLVQAMLTRAALPLDTVALAVCILDSLDARFSRTWRLTCPLNQEVGGDTAGERDGEQHESEKGTARTHMQPIKRHTLPPLSPLPAAAAAAAAAAYDRFSFSACSPSPSTSFYMRHPRHIDSVFPEVIILAALVIATKFTDDGCAGQQAAQSYCAWGQSEDTGAHADAPLRRRVPLWSASQFSATERCVMQSLGYRILPLLDADLLADARDDMRRAGMQATRAQQRCAQQQEQQNKLGLAVAAEAAEAAEAAAAAAAVAVAAVAETAAERSRRHHVVSRSECLGLFGR